MRLRKPIQLVLAAFFTLARMAAGAENNRGVISGTVRLDGHIPIVRSVQPPGDSDVCGNAARPVQSLCLGTNQTVRDVIVYLAGSAPNGASRGTNDAVILDQRNCEFVPRIQLARSGVPLILRNNDPVLHVVRIDSMSGTNGTRPLLKVATPYAGFEKTYRLANFREPTLLQVASGNGEDWMAGYIAVMPHPWAVLTDENGRFTLRNVPPGLHKIYAWHEILGTLTKDVRVNPEGFRSATVDFQFTTVH
jgi:hypothetical protein